MTHLQDISTLDNLLTALASKKIEIIDLTTPLSETTPIIKLPPERGQPWPFEREVISCYDEAGPMVYWNNIKLSEHTGTHFDAPIHWLSGKNLEDVSQVSPSKLIAPAVVLDLSERTVDDCDFLLQRHHVESWCNRYGALPEGCWLLYRTGWDSKMGEDFLNDGHTPGIDPSCAKWLAEETPVIGIGVETVGTDAGQAHSFEEQEFPCHWFFHGANKYGLTQLKNLKLLPPKGAVVIIAPLPIVRGSGSPARVFALIQRE